ncbi:MAG: IPT/TIG domain-containing protein [Prolixibacteraceae bacterium]|nr:IPT/TIG domain-containing protein [Prolixibacteraceae bacterium]
MIIKTIKIIALLAILYSCLFSCGQKEDQLPVADAPVISSFTPSSGSEGTSITISGSNFGSKINSNIITIGGVNAIAVSATSTQLIVTLPAGILPGDYRISVKVGSQSSASTQLFSVKTKEEITDPEVLAYNYALGTQTIGPSYGHTSEDRLIETAKATLNMGSNILKITLAPGSYNITGRPAYSNLTALVRDDPSFKQVLDMPFSYYFFWARSHSNWKDGYSASERRDDSTQIADLTSYLLTKYNNSGKQFFLGHWEGDWYLLDNYDANFFPSDERINGMIQWYIARQNAVDQALKNTPHSKVDVFTYSEVNRVVDAMNGKKRVVNQVLPFTNVDYVSYSSYDAQSLSQSEYNQVLNYIEGNLPKRDHIKGKRVFIGEMGRSAMDFSFSKTQHEQVNRENMRKALVWGAPFVLYWEMYNNEIKDGVQRGFWLIDDKNEKWPLYYSFSSFYSKAKNWVLTQKKTLNRLPTREEFNVWAAGAL